MQGVYINNVEQPVIAFKAFKNILHDLFHYHFIKGIK